MAADAPPYLKPYLTAARRYGGGFGSLLWASPRTQRLRFDALIRAVGGDVLRGRRLLDLGCGRADLLDHLRQRKVEPAAYVGIEAVPELADVAAAKGATVVRGDFVRDPDLMRSAGADVVVVSGSFNTVDRATFDPCVRAAWAAAGTALAFNFLASTELAGQPHLTWHRPADLRALAASLSADVGYWDDYLPGDATVVIRRVSSTELSCGGSRTLR